MPTKSMIDLVGQTTPQAHVFEGARGCLHAPVVGPLKLRGLPRISHLNPKHLAPVRLRNFSCTAISSLSKTDTRSHSNKASMATEDVEIPIPELQQLCQDALKTLGYDEQQRATISEVCKFCAAPSRG